MVLAQPRLVTIDEFTAFIAQPENADRLFELIDGEIVEKVTSEEHGAIIFLLVTELGIYLKQNPIGRGGVEVHHRRMGDQHNARVPDLSINLDLERPIVREGAVPKMPDFAVEVKSRENTYLELRQKAAFFIANGSKLVWLIFPQKRLIEVYRPGVDVEILTVEDTLDGYDVLPGFALPVSTVFS